MRTAKTLLTLLTEAHPPFPGAKHAIVVHEDTLMVVLSFGPAEFKHFTLEEEDLDRRPEHLAKNISNLLAAQGMDADKVKSALAWVHDHERRVENAQGMTRLEATRAALHDFALTDAERGVLLRALNIEPYELS